MLIYLMLITFLILTGFGFISFFIPSMPFAARLCIAPYLTWMIWLWLTAIILYLGGTVEQALPFIGLITLFFIVIGVKKLTMPNRQLLFCLLFAMMIPILLMKSVFFHGLLTTFGNFSFDGWRYSASSLYIWNHSIDNKVLPYNASPLNHYGYLIFNDYFRMSIGDVFLGALAWLGGHPGDAFTVLNLVLAAFLTTFFYAAIGFASLTQRSAFFIIVYLTLLAFSGWVYEIAAINNVDNLLAISFFPVLAIVLFSENRLNYLKLSLLVGFLLGSIYYQYVEYLPLIIIAFIAFLFQYYWNLRMSFKKLITMLLVILSTAVIFFWPYSQMIFYYFIHYQLPSTLHGSIGGEIYHGRLSWASYWTNSSVLNPSRLTIISAILWVFFVIGLMRSIKRKQWGWVSFGLVSIGGYAWMMHWFPYGAYKFIVLGLWLNMFYIVEAFDWLISQKRVFKMVFSVLFLLIIGNFFQQQFVNEQNFFRSFQQITGLSHRIKQSKQVQKIVNLTGDDLISMQADNWVLNAMAIYYLNDSTHLVCPIGTSFAESFCIAPKVMQVKPHYILTDYPNPKLSLVWFKKPYYLYRI